MVTPKSTNKIICDLAFQEHFCFKMYAFYTNIHFKMIFIQYGFSNRNIYYICFKKNKLADKL